MNDWQIPVIIGLLVYIALLTTLNFISHVSEISWMNRHQ